MARVLLLDNFLDVAQNIYISSTLDHTQTRAQVFFFGAFCKAFASGSNPLDGCRNGRVAGKFSYLQGSGQKGIKLKYYILFSDFIIIYYLKSGLPKN
jgi:hypothetical protein